MTGPRPKGADNASYDRHRPRFDLLDEPWIPVLPLPGTVPQGRSQGGSPLMLVGLRELIPQAGRFRRIVGDTPPQTAALHRLILAALHRAYSCPTITQWAALWQAGGFPTDTWEDYLTTWADRFDLFDPDRPFLQCPGLATISPHSTAELVAYRVAGNNRTLFDHTTADQRPLLDPAEAARWLVTLLGYDTGGTKTGAAEGNHSQSGAPLNEFACVLVEGATLAETLLQNLLEYAPAYGRPEQTKPRDQPAWEADPPPARPATRLSKGWADRLTWPSRRILLHPAVTAESIQVDGVVITPGTKIQALTSATSDESDLYPGEHMAAFGITPRSTRTMTAKSPQAVRLDPLRGIWRHAQDLLLPDDRTHRRPEAITQLERRLDHDLLPETTVVTLRVFGQRLGTKGGSIVSWAEESIPAPVALLRAANRPASELLGRAVVLADTIGLALSDLESDFHEIFHGKDRTSTTKKNTARPSQLAEVYWPLLPPAFEDFLRAVGLAVSVAGSVLDGLDVWADAVHRASDTAVHSWITAGREGRQTLALGRCQDRFNTRRDQARATFISQSRRATDLDGSIASGAIA